MKYSIIWDDDTAQKLIKFWNSEPETLDEHGRKLLERICETPTIDDDETVVVWTFLVGWRVPGGYTTVLKRARDSETYAREILNPELDLFVRYPPGYDAPGAAFRRITRACIPLEGHEDELVPPDPSIALLPCRSNRYPYLRLSRCGSTT